MHSEIITVLLVWFLATASCRLNSNVQHIARASNRFGDAIYKELAKAQNNVIFAPSSAHTVLAMIALGSGGKTHQGLLSNLFLTESGILEKGYAEIIHNRNKSETDLHIANTFFSTQDYPIRKSYKQAAKLIFDVIPQEINFRSGKTAVNVINKWVAEETNGTISTVLNDIYPDTAMVLINAMYFKGTWSIKFNKSSTIKNFIFHAPNKNVKCEMMVMRQRHKCLFTNTLTLVELDFKDTDIKIAFIKPRISLKDIERLLDSKTFFKLRRNLKPTLINLQMPKFTLSSKSSLKQALKTIGVSDIFLHPDFSGIFSNPLPYGVDDIFQKNVIKVDEEGASAASVTAAIMVARSVATISPHVVLDSPFLFYLYDSNNEIVLMRGRIENPTG